MHRNYDTWVKRRKDQSSKPTNICSIILSVLCLAYKTHCADTSACTYNHTQPDQSNVNTKSSRKGGRGGGWVGGGGGGGGHERNM